MKFYSDDEFAHESNDSIGNVKYFKKRLREIGKIEVRQQLSDDFIEVFKEVKRIKGTNHTTWEKAIDHVLKTTYQSVNEITDNTNDSQILKEILETLKRIEQKL